MKIENSYIRHYRWKKFRTLFYTIRKIRKTTPRLPHSYFLFPGTYIASVCSEVSIFNTLSDAPRHKCLIFLLDTQFVIKKRQFSRPRRLFSKVDDKKANSSIPLRRRHFTFINVRHQITQNSRRNWLSPSAPFLFDDEYQNHDSRMISRDSLKAGEDTRLQSEQY